MDNIDETSHDCAAAIRHSLRKVFHADTYGVISGVTTDSGGGFTGASFATALSNENLCDTDFFLTAFGTVHCLQLTLSNAAKSVFGDGGWIMMGDG